MIFQIVLFAILGLRALSAPHIWPYPNSINLGNNTVVLDSHHFTLSMKTPSEDVQDAFDRFMSVLFQHNGVDSPPKSIQSLIIDVHSVSVPLTMHVDESYTLTVKGDGSPIEITSETIYGAYHGLKTLSQLITFDVVSETYVISQVPLTIKDKPIYSHRGLLLDTGSHYIPKSGLKRIIDSMYYNKLNVLHWQISTASSVPFQSSIYEYLWEGSFSEEERYTIEDIKEIVSYSTKRGIRVIPEYSILSHSDAWCLDPDLCPSLQCTNPVNPTANITMYLLTDVIQEWIGTKAQNKPSIYLDSSEESSDEPDLNIVNQYIQELDEEKEDDHENTPIPFSSYAFSSNQDREGLFIDEYVHLAGDNINTDCWNSVESIKNWMKKKNVTAFETYYSLYSEVEKIVYENQKQIIIYDSLYSYLKDRVWKNTTIQILNSESILKQGYDVIFSNDTLWNVNMKENTWKKVYNYDFTSSLKNQTYTGHLLGGELIAYTSTIDSSDLFSSLYPTLSAVAERLWSPSLSTITESSQTRLFAFRFYLMNLGIYSTPITSRNIRDAPDCPGSYFSQ